MLDYFKKYYVQICTAFLLCFVLWAAYGCEPKTRSLIQPRHKVNAKELQVELETLVGMYNIRIDDLKKKLELQQWFFEQAGQFATTGTANPVGVLMSLLSVMGIGAGADNLRVRKKLKNARITTKPENENS